MKLKEQISHGDRVKLKGRVPAGVIEKMGVDSKWVSVNWDKETPGPKYCHLYEVERIN